ncbi:MAG: hydrogenase nickel incorporation protein HypB [Candidatus Lokiarchaeota archaeon]|nr:hydrogenase nickel incorporation protein HypB [Candidatus Lokiarchaeota archaeon]MBD3202219.1 hydrogenase nickel incorporation protein HypB [Candidatus Lokiarchaeota archaeon]
MSEDDKVSKIIELNEDLIKTNDRIAQQNKELFFKYKIKSFDIVGAIGAGKTSLLEEIVENLSKNYRILVINGDITTRIDADRIERRGARSIQINTGRECALNSYHISQVLHNNNLSEYDLVFIENVGNLICPSDFILGVNKRVVVVSITEGEWVIKKHPLLFKMSDIAIINKIDLLDVVEVNLEQMIRDAMDINPNLKIFTTSCKTGENIPSVIKALLE